MTEPNRGYCLVRSILDAQSVQGLLRLIDRRYRAIEEARARQGLGAIAAELAANERFAPTASSLTLSPLLGESGMTILLRSLASGRISALLRPTLGANIAVNLDQAWVRRQYAPARYPPLHAPHGWHQDGALAFDFLALGCATPPPNALLDMVTCWISLTPCGRDAPGLEMIARTLNELVPMDDLRDAELRCRFPEIALERPLLDPGDALLFPGGTIHRTHVTSHMPGDRTSVELRFFRADAIPRRLQGDRFIRWQ